MLLAYILTILDLDKCPSGATYRSSILAQFLLLVSRELPQHGSRAMGRVGLHA